MTYTWKCRACGRPTTVLDWFETQREHVLDMSRTTWLSNPLCKRCAAEFRKNKEARRDGR